MCDLCRDIYDCPVCGNRMWPYEVDEEPEDSIDDDCETPERKSDSP